MEGERVRLHYTTTTSVEAWSLSEYGVEITGVITLQRKPILKPAAAGRRPWPSIRVRPC